MKLVNLATHLEQDLLTIALIAPLDFTVQIRIQELFVMADTSAQPKLVTRLLTPQPWALSLKMDLNLKLTVLRVPIKTRPPKVPAKLAPLAPTVTNLK